MLTLRQFLSCRILPTLDRAHNLSIAREITTRATIIKSRFTVDMEILENIKHSLNFIRVSGNVYHVEENWENDFPITNWKTRDINSLELTSAINGYVVLSQTELDTMKAL